MSPDCHVDVRFYLPPEHLRRYFTTFSVADITVGGGERVTDWLQPEWGNVRFLSGDCPDAAALGGSQLSGAAFVATGPSSQAIRFTIGTSRLWGVGLLPLGWTQFVDAPASKLADTVVDGFSHAAFAGFASLARRLIGSKAGDAADLELIIEDFSARAANPVLDEARIVAIHEAVVDPDVTLVSELAERTGESQRTIERLCDRVFGFSPKRLLRRQRFMRSLAQFMLDPSLNWIGALDSHYHDQAQFVRDFHKFMGMTPSEYAQTPHPILGAFMRERARMAGAAVQTLDAPMRVDSAAVAASPANP